jgi:hypothetical protein
MPKKIEYKPPEWKLNNKWGIKRDAYNWMLCYEVGARWVPKGYYPSIELLLKDFYRKMLLSNPPEEMLIDHLTKVSEGVQQAIKQLSNSMGKPPTLQHVLDRQERLAAEKKGKR